MTEKLRSHINLLFEDAPQTRRAFELKEELLANLIERYNDMVEQGMCEEDAYRNAIANIGDVNELISNLKENDILNSNQGEGVRKKTALVLTISVALYFLAFIFAMVMITVAHFSPVIGLLVMIGMAIIPTCLWLTISPPFPAIKNMTTALLRISRNGAAIQAKTKEYEALFQEFYGR
jgi:hypothetical protein